MHNIINSVFLGCFIPGLTDAPASTPGQSILFSFFAGASTVIGVLFLMLCGKPNKRILAGLLGFAGGIMIAISLFDLMPEAINLSSEGIAAITFLLGVAMMFIVDSKVPHAHVSSLESLEIENPEHAPNPRNPLLRSGYLVLFGIALHNLPEGLAIGAGVHVSPQLGLSLAIAIALHNIPEGLAIGGPLRAGGMGRLNVILLVLAAGLVTPFGTLIGQFLFSVSETFVGCSLAFAAGAMMYIAFDELVPNANKLHAHAANIGISFAIVFGLLL